MSGHSKWATTKHKKAAIDAKRGKLFAKLIKNIEIAARMGGGDPDGNPSLYDAIYKAKKASMPADNIKRAVKRGSGEEAGGANYEDIVYEGYAPAGVGLIIECLTDNRNRAAAEVRSTLTKGNGSLATSGSVSFNFERKGQIEVPSEGVDFDDLFEKAGDAGAEDVIDDGDVFTVITDPSDLHTIRCRTLVSTTTPPIWSCARSTRCRSALRTPRRSPSSSTTSMTWTMCRTSTPTGPHPTR